MAATGEGGGDAPLSDNAVAMIERGLLVITPVKDAVGRPVLLYRPRLLDLEKDTLDNLIEVMVHKLEEAVKSFGEGVTSLIMVQDNGGAPTNIFDEKLRQFDPKVMKAKVFDRFPDRIHQTLIINMPGFMKPMVWMAKMFGMGGEMEKRTEMCGSTGEDTLGQFIADEAGLNEHIRPLLYSPVAL